MVLGDVCVQGFKGGGSLEKGKCAVRLAAIHTGLFLARAHARRHA